MDLTQTILLSVIIVLTIFLAVIGFQIFFVIREFRKTLFRANKLLDDADDLLGQVKRPIETAGNLLTSAAAGMGIAHILRKVVKHERSEQK